MKQHLCCCITLLIPQHPNARSRDETRPSRQTDRSNPFASAPRLSTVLSTNHPCRLLIGSSPAMRSSRCQTSVAHKFKLTHGNIRPAALPPLPRAYFREYRTRRYSGDRVQSVSSERKRRQRERERG
jgi:hypothetical protein